MLPKPNSPSRFLRSARQPKSDACFLPPSHIRRTREREDFFSNKGPFFFPSSRRAGERNISCAGVSPARSLAFSFSLRSSSKRARAGPVTQNGKSVVGQSANREDCRRFFFVILLRVCVCERLCFIVKHLGTQIVPETHIISSNNKALFSRKFQLSSLSVFLFFSPNNNCHKR